MTYRGLIHFHSRFSYDSNTSIESIVNFALKKKLNFLILTDHDTIKGSQNLKEYVAENNYDIEVLIAAEYCTEYGDVIAINISEEVRDMTFKNFVLDVRSQGGFILFPHPYVGHKNIEEIANNSDLIEVFNSRVSDEKNKKSLELANKYSKKAYFSSDAHNKNSLNNGIVEFKKNGDLVQSLLNSNMILEHPKKTFLYEIYSSQIVKSLKQKNIKLLLRMGLNSIKAFMLLKLFRRV